MIRSFRLRLALLSALLTGLVLLLFGAASWWLIRESKTQRLDTELRAFAEREVNRERSAAQWQAETQRLASALGLANPQDVVLLLQDASGQTLYQSGDWPAAFAPAQLPWPGAPAPRAQGPTWLGQAVAAELPPDARPPRPDGLGPRPPPGERPPHRLGERPRPPRPGLGDEAPAGTPGAAPVPAPTFTPAFTPALTPVPTPPGPPAPLAAAPEPAPAPSPADRKSVV